MRSTNPRSGNIKKLSVLYDELKKANRLRFRYILVSVVISLFFGTIIFFAAPQLIQKLNNQHENQNQEQEMTQVFVDGLFEILKRDKATVVLVEDPVKAQQDNPEAARFYRDSQPGDVMIIFQQSSFAVLYRPQTGQIISAAIIRRQI